MRTPICDINIIPPTPAVSTLVAENKNLTAKNDSMKVLIKGALVIGIICLGFHLRKKYLKKVKQEKESGLKIN